MLHIILQAGWDPDGVIRVLERVGILVGVIATAIMMVLNHRKLEVIRGDVNSAKSLLELKLAQALEREALHLKSEAVRTGDPVDQTAADRAVGAAENAAVPLVAVPAKP